LSLFHRITLDVIKKIWNVSWDITFLRYINSLAARIVSGEDISPKANFVLETALLPNLFSLSV